MTFYSNLANERMLRLNITYSDIFASKFHDMSVEKVSS